MNAAGRQPSGATGGARRYFAGRLAKLAAVTAVLCGAALWVLPRLPQRVALRDGRTLLGVLERRPDGGLELRLGGGERVALSPQAIAGRSPPTPGEVWDYFVVPPPQRVMPTTVDEAARYEAERSRGVRELERSRETARQAEEERRRTEELGRQVDENRSGG